MPRSGELFSHTVVVVDFPLNSSLVLAAAVGLWLLWVAPQYLHGKQVPAPSPGRCRHRRTRSQQCRHRTGPKFSGEHHAQHQHRRPAHAAPERDAPGQEPASRRDAAPAPVPGPLKIRYGRLTLAVLGLLFIAHGPWPEAQLRCSVPCPAGSPPVPPSVPLPSSYRCAASLSATSVNAKPAVLPLPHSKYRHRRAARAQQSEGGYGLRRRRQDADRKAEPPAAAEPVRPAAPQPKPVPRLTAQELRAAALAEAAKSAEASSWQPVAVPKPTYVDAPAAPRPAPAPLAVPASPKPVLKTPIRPLAAPAAGSTAIEPRPATGILNLDDVLQRRRA